MIWLQRDDLAGGRASKEAMMVYRWALLEQEQIRWFTPAEMLDGHLPLSPADPVIGSVECVSAALRQLGVPVPEPDYYPECLKPYLHRWVERQTVGELRRRLLDGQTVFAKSHVWKRLTGQVFSPSDLDQLSSLSDTDPVWLSEPVVFEAEYRAYIVGDQVRAICQYGEAEDRMLTVDQVRTISEATARLVEATPRAARVVDWGLLPGGRVALVEVGDAWAIGCYPGVLPWDYAECLLTRWHEMVQA